MTEKERQAIVEGAHGSARELLDICEKIFRHDARDGRGSPVHPLYGARAVALQILEKEWADRLKKSPLARNRIRGCQCQEPCVSLEACPSEVDSN